MTSETLGLESRFEDDRMRLWDRQARGYLLEQREERAGRLEKRDKRIVVEQRAPGLESEVADLRVRLRGRP